MPDNPPCTGNGFSAYFCWQGVPYYFPDPPVGVRVYPIITVNEDDTVTCDWGNDEGGVRAAQSAMRKRKPKRPGKKPPN